MAEKSTGVSEIRFTVDSEFLKELQRRLGIERSTDIARSALTLLDWASSETSSGRVILSSNAQGDDVHRLVMPELKPK